MRGMSLRELLAPSTRFVDPYWCAPEYTSAIDNWNNLADTNAIHAAISANDEKYEREKSQQQIELLQQELNPGVILDLGCGYGRVAKYILDARTFDGYIGLDSSRTMLKIFAERYQEQASKTPLLFLYSDIDHIPLADASVDNVIVSAVFLHNPKAITKRSLEEVHRVLRPGGKVFILSSFPARTSLMSLQGDLYLLLLGLFGKGRKNGPVRYFSRAEVARLLAAFTHTDIRAAGSRSCRSRCSSCLVRSARPTRSMLRSPLTPG